VLNKREIQDWLILHIAELLHVPPDAVDIHESFSNYGLSSLDVVSLSGDLEELLGRRLSPTLAYDYPNILALSNHLAENIESKKSSAVTNSMTDTSAEPIAVIGMSCRFPGAKDPESFWQLLRDGVDMIREVPEDRWNKHAFYHPDSSVPGKSISYWGGFLENIDQFDPFFFGISPIEAKYMDPQQRLLLELSNEALDDAGQIKKNLADSKTGVFIGISLNEYSQLQFDDPSMITSHSGTGNALSIAANRISYFFNFHGPSMAIDTACSSSLTAVHLACQSIRSGECRMALAGGVNIILTPANSIAFTKAGVLAPDGRCKTFDARANGYVRGEGGGLIVLKSLSSALADGDPIHSLILGSAIHQDGRTNGLMAPSSEEQEIMLREAYKAAGILPGNVQYVEAHGTGTLLGDSMEAKALGKVIGADRKNGPCAIGSVKTNIGHFEAAAGIAGLIKVILSLKHRTIPPSIHYHSPNPHIPFDELNLCVNDKLKSLSPGSDPVLAAVSSFGFGGTNVHVIMSEAFNNDQIEIDNKQVHTASFNCHLLPLSANSPEALHSMAGNFLELLSSDSSIAANDICYAASVRRSQDDYRLAVIGNSKEELYTNLRAFKSKEHNADLFIGDKASHRQPKLTFVFSGQGGQWYGMGRELLKQEPVFYKAIERIDRLIREKFSWSLIDELDAEKTVSRLNEIDVVQPALFAIQVALAELWQSWGIKPDAVVGHSMGEVASAYIAGILSLEDAIKIVCSRSELLKQLRGKGSMMVTELSPVQAKEVLNGYDKEIAIAVFNSPSSTVLSGDTETINKVKDSLDRQNLFCKLVNVDVASHSPQIDHLRSDMYKVLEGLDPQPASLPIYSTVTGAKGNDLNFNADYWIDNLRKPVLFSDAIGQLLDDGCSTFIEIGPHPVLLSSIQQSLKSYHTKVRLLPSIRRDEPERKVLFGSLAALYTEGFSVDWNTLYPNGGKYVSLPLIPWQRQRYWIEAKSAGSKNLWHSGKNYHPMLGERMNLANSPSTFVWQTFFDDEMLILLQDHKIENDIVFPAAGYIEMALQVAKEINLNQTHELSDFVIKESMILQTGKPRSIQVILSPEKDGNFKLNVYSQPAMEEHWILHASANFIQEQGADHLEALEGTSPNIIRQQSTSQFTAEEFYQTLHLHGIQYGPAFQVIQHIWSKDDESLGLISLPESLQYNSNVYQIHPALLDGCLQVLAATQTNSSEHNLYIPTGCRRIRFFSKPDGLITSHVILRSEPGSATDDLYADIKLSDSNGQPVAELIGFSLQRTSRRIRNLLSQQDTWMYRLQWQVQKQATISPVTLRNERHWLIFADDQGYGEELAKQLKASGDHCHLLLFKDTFRNSENFQEDFFTEIIEKCLKDIPSSLHGIIHCWSLSTPYSSVDRSATEDITQMPGCNSVLYLVKSLTKRLAVMPNLWLVTRGAQSVNSDEPIAIEQSALWGLGKVISFELPELKCIRVDLDCKQSIEQTIPDLIKQISTDDREDQIAFRAGRRFVLRLLPFKTSSHTQSFLLRSDSTYLITGGLGALGIRTAKWLVQKGARHLVLSGRSEPSPLVMNMIEQMRHEGTEVFIAQADVSDQDQLKNVVDKIKNSMPVLRGVVHAAGVLDDGSILNLNEQRMKKVMAPKVDGAWNLHNATLNLPLDFFVLFSSAVSVLGSPGQGNYAAASSYLDAMAHYRRYLGLPAISINWGPWADVGLAAETFEKLKEGDSLNQHLIKVIKIDQGLEILEQLIIESTPQVMVLPFDLKNLIELYPTAGAMPFLSEVGGNETHVARLYARPNLRQEYVAPRNEIELKLAELWRHTLHIDRVGVQDSFFELGGDSVLAAQILSLVQKNFGIRINPQDAFKAFTIERLAAMLEAEILTKIEAMSEDEVQQLLSKRN
jgi:myxalamid-type polyketide synthase MxaE and MxaD